MVATSSKKYSINFRFVIKYKGTTRNDAFYTHYMPKWSLLLRSVMKDPLSRLSICDLPYLRRVVPSNVTVNDLTDVIISKDPVRARLLIEAAPIFDSSPHDLKVHIISSFGIVSNEYDNYMRQNKI